MSHSEMAALGHENTCYTILSVHACNTWIKKTSEGLEREKL